MDTNVGQKLLGLIDELLLTVNKYREQIEFELLFFLNEYIPFTIDLNTLRSLLISEFDKLKNYFALPLHERFIS
jgi:hypothetical protein